MNVAIIIVVSVGGGMVVLFLVLFSVFYALKSSLEKEVYRRYGERVTIRKTPWANFFGQQSRGYGQVRGNGALVLVEDELYFLLGVPRREFIIPLKDIIEVSMPISHLGKSSIRPLLHVRYRTETGEEDAVAWAVKEPEKWKEAIEMAKKEDDWW